MRFAGIALFATLILATLATAASAQSGWPDDPFSELLQSFGPTQPVYRGEEQAVDENRTTRREQHRQAVRRRPHSTAGQSRIIRAQAEVTIIDRDHITVTLTRRGIGTANGSASSRR